MLKNKVKFQMCIGYRLWLTCTCSSTINKKYMTAQLFMVPSVPTTTKVGGFGLHVISITRMCLSCGNMYEAHVKISKLYPRTIYTFFCIQSC